MMITAHKMYRGAKVTFSGYNLKEVRTYIEETPSTTPIGTMPSVASTTAPE